MIFSIHPQFVTEVYTDENYVAKVSQKYLKETSVVIHLLFMLKSLLKYTLNNALLSY